MAEPRLPMDMLIEVLILLPVKSILKFRCVSKTWRDLVSSPPFIHRHLICDRKRSVLLVKRTTDHGLPPENEESQILSFHDPDSPELLVSPHLPIPIPNDLKFPTYNRTNTPVHGTCNGLVCIALGHIVFLCNPALREFKLLPPLKFPGYLSAYPLGYGFGFYQSGGVYKVIQILNVECEWVDISNPSYEPVENDHNRVYLYDSASNSWKQIDVQVPYIGDSPSVGLFFNGAIHWYAFTPSGNPCILCFDTSVETFRRLDIDDNFPPPCEIDPRLMEKDGSLAMFLWNNSMYLDRPGTSTEIWVMKEYGVKESWTKQIVVGTYFYIARPLVFLKNGWLVYENYKAQLAACAIHGNQIKEFEIHGYHFSFSAVVYEESLISLEDIIPGGRD